MKISICKLTVELLDDWLSFFDNDAFSDNDEWCRRIVCAIIGIASWKRNEDGIAIKIAQGLIENKQSTL